MERVGAAAWVVGGAEAEGEARTKWGTPLGTTMKPFASVLLFVVPWTPQNQTKIEMNWNLILWLRNRFKVELKNFRSNFKLKFQFEIKFKWISIYCQIQVQLSFFSFYLKLTLHFKGELRCEFELKVKFRIQKFIWIQVSTSNWNFISKYIFFMFQHATSR